MDFERVYIAFFSTGLRFCGIVTAEALALSSGANAAASANDAEPSAASRLPHNPRLLQLPVDIRASDERRYIARSSPSLHVPHFYDQISLGCVG